MNKLIFLCLTLMSILPARSTEDRLTTLLEQGIRREATHPDSIEWNLNLLEQEYQNTTGVRRAVTAACMAQLYAQRAYTEVTGKWTARSIELYRTALSFKAELYAAPTKDWIPLVKRGRDEKIYGQRMLYVVWRSAWDYMPHDSLPMTRQELIDYYAAQGNTKPATIQAQIDKLQRANDSIWSNAPSLGIKMAQVYYPGDSLNIKFEAKNVTDITYTIHDSKGKPVTKTSNPLLAPTQPGKYTLRATSTAAMRLRHKPRHAEATFYVSTLQAFTIDTPGPTPTQPKDIMVKAVDAKSGRPCPQATINIDRKNQSASISLDTDSFLPKIKYWETYTYTKPQDKYTTRTEIFADRSIYRPGQEIKVSAIVYEQRHWDAHTKPGEKVTFTLQDSDRKTILTKEAITDHLGTASISLSLPEHLDKLGTYTIRTNTSGVRTIRIEEYKRPQFYIQLDNEKDWHRQDSTIWISGQAQNYNGTPLRNARVTGQSHRLSCWWWRGPHTAATHDLDTIYTDREGRFAMPIHINDAQQPSQAPIPLRYFPTLHVSLSIHSTTGESHQASAMLRLFDDPQPEAQQPQQPSWAEATSDTIDTDTPSAILLRNTTSRPMYVFLTGFAQDNIIIDTILTVSDTLSRYPVSYDPSYGDGLILTATYVMDGIVHNKSLTFKRRMPRRDLQLHWDTFRDYTQPGAVEQWSLRLTEPDGTNAKANLMLSVYDKSLDALYRNTSITGISMNHYLPHSITRYNNAFAPQRMTTYQNFDLWTYKIKNYDYSTFDPKYFDLPVTAGITPILRDKAYIKYAKAPTQKQNSTMSSRGEGSDYFFEPSSGQAPLEEQPPHIQARTQFDETAYFAPQLRTDSQGRIQVSFTIPQSLTTWAVRGLAHTADMHYTTLDTTFIARKALMAQLQMPRFLRESDSAELPLHITNTTQAKQQVKAQLTVTPTGSKKPLLKQTYTLTLDTQADTVLTASLFVPEGIQGLSIRLTASTPHDSDGEQREIPIHANTAHLTATKALTIEPGQSTQLTWQDLFPTISTHRQVIIERNTDPKQSAIEALQQLTLPEQDDVLTLAAAHYATTRLGQTDSLSYIDQLTQMQNPDGGLSWYKGFSSSPYCTTEVGYMLSRLHKRDPKTDALLDGICRYLTTTTTRQLKHRETHDKKWVPTLSDLRTAYVLTARGTTQPDSTHTLVKRIIKHLDDDYDNQESEYLSIRLIIEKALSGKTNQKCLETLKRRLTHTDGTYLAYRAGAYPSIDRRIHIHTQVMEALRQVTPDDTQTLTAMRHHLLNQKRTQGWGTAVNCVDAAFAILGDDHKPTAPTHPDPIRRDTIDIIRRNTLDITNTAQDPIWVGIYASYTQPYDKVESHSTELSVQDISPDETIKANDHHTTRIKITACRDYNYIQVSIPRAAALEPQNPLSGHTWQSGISYYRQVRDQSIEYYIESLPHGEYIIEETFTAERKGQYNTGIPTIKCIYADEFRGHGKNKQITLR